MTNSREIKKSVAANGMTVYRLPVEAFRNHVTNCYLVMDDGPTLIDAGSGRGSSNEDLEASFTLVQELFSEKVRISDVGRLIITHAHVDHFGGLNYVIEQSGAQLGFHELDASVAERSKERTLVSSKNLHLFLDRTGIPPKLVETLVERNRRSKGSFASRNVDFTFVEGLLPDSPFYVYHVPGHCPGQVCLRLDDILFTADHVLSRTTPHQAPEVITKYTGLGHYLESLQKIRGLPEISVGLGGHEEEMVDLPSRIDDIVAFHNERLEKTLAFCEEPKTISELSLELFGKRVGHHIQLALLETGAHVEYLYERGHLAVSNIDDLESEYNPVLYYRLP
jgi:glyoxylase-like metal-dependent hydrolase (beta-lactamase superfamily II)